MRKMRCVVVQGSPAAGIKSGITDAERRVSLIGSMSADWSVVVAEH